MEKEQHADFTVEILQTVRVIALANAIERTEHEPKFITRDCPVAVGARKVRCPYPRLDYRLGAGDRGDFDNVLAP